MYRLKITLIVLLFAGFCGCNLLENQKPQQSLPFEGGINNVNDLESAVTGMYDHLQTIEGDNFAETIFGNDIITNETVFTGSFPTFKQIAQRRMSKNNGSIESMWNGAYEDINDANIILSSVDGVKEASQDTKDNIKGQALFVRSLQYFYLLQLFSLPASAGESNMGVPLQLDAVTSQEDFSKPSRSSIGDVYDKIVNDLQTAQGLLPSVSDDKANPRNRANKEAATALLARIALVRGNYQKAADYSKDVLKSTKIKLLPDVTTDFRTEAPPLSAETIFLVQNTTQDTPDASNTSISAVYNIGQRDDIHIGQSFLDALKNELNARQKSAIATAGATATDTRVTELLINGNGHPSDISEVTVGTTDSDKYEDDINAADNVPILRAPEMILTRAEALAHLNGINKPSIDLLNRIRERAFNVEGGSESLVDYKKRDFSSKQDLIDAIFNERFVELAFEGHAKADLQRTKRDIVGLNYDDNSLVYPIPQTQTDANKNIDQNPGYGN